ncbi:hypothetical protein [Brachybacterium sp.]
MNNPLAEVRRADLHVLTQVSDLRMIVPTFDRAAAAPLRRTWTRSPRSTG